MSGEDERREEGVEFTEIDPVLEGISYPIEKTEFVRRYGDRTLERTNADPITIRELFEGTGEDTFESAAEVRRGVLNLMPRDSVGRQRYSDRGGQASGESPDEDGGDESV